MKFFKLLLAAVIVLPLCGCFGNEPNDVAYIVALGFDKAENESDYKITIQFAKPTQISGGASESGGKAGADIIENITVEAPDIYAGINTANHIVSKKFSLYHTKLFVFSGDVAREGISDLLETMSRSEEIRPDVYMAVAPDGANKYLTAVKPVVELNPAKYYQLTYDKNDSAGFPRCTLQDFYFISKVDYADAAVPLAGVMKSGENDEKTVENKEKSAPKNNGGFEYKIRNYHAGEVAVEEENKSETMGMAVFSGQKMSGMMGSTDSVLYNILKGEYRGSYVTFKEKEGFPVPVTVKMTQNKKPHIKVNVKKNMADITVYLESDFYSLSSDYILENQIEEFEKNAASEIESACEEFIDYVRDEYNSDIVGIGEKAKKHFADYKSFEAYNWRERFKTCGINVKVNFKVRRTGLTMREEN